MDKSKENSMEFENITSESDEELDLEGASEDIAGADSEDKVVAESNNENETVSQIQDLQVLELVMESSMETTGIVVEGEESVDTVERDDDDFEDLVDENRSSTNDTKISKIENLEGNDEDEASGDGINLNSKGMLDNIDQHQQDSQGKDENSESVDENVVSKENNGNPDQEECRAPTLNLSVKEMFGRSTKFTEEEMLFMMQDGMGDEEPKRRVYRIPKMPIEKILSMMKDPLPEKKAERDRRRKIILGGIRKLRERELIMIEIADDICGYFTDEYLQDQSVDDLKKNIMNEFSSSVAKAKVISTVELILRQSLFLESSTQKVAALGFFIRVLGETNDPVQQKMICVIDELLNPENYPDEHYDDLLNARPLMALNEVEKAVVSKLKDADSLSSIWEENIEDLIEIEPKLEEPEPSLQAELEENEKKEFSSEFDPSVSELLDIKQIMSSPYEKPPGGSQFYAKKELSVDENIAQFLSKVIEDPDAFIHLPRFLEPMFTNEEMAWMNPNNLGAYQFELMRDINSKTRSEERDERIRELIKTALKEALSITQRQKLIDELKNGPLNARNVGVNPSVMPELVENNPVVSIDILLKLMEGGDQMQDYLASITDMDMSVHSMEVVNRLTSSVKLPDEFLYKYVSNCIKTCEGMQDKFVQSRLVRLLCVFLQSLIRNQLFDFQILYIEILSFCITFSRIREAAALYRLMKQVEGEDPELREMLSGKLENHQHLSEEAARNFAIKDKDAKS